MTQKMKTIGLIGGMSWESSKVYYQYTNQLVRSHLGGSHSAKSIMITVDFDQIEKWSFTGEWDKIGQLMATHARTLEKAGADMILLCTNTIHIVSHYITDAVAIPFLHIAAATGNTIKAKGLKKVGLLGTRFTMEKDFYTKILQDNYGLEVVTPPKEERDRIHDIIYNELVQGKFTEASKKQCIEMIYNLSERGAEGVIMGCTELPILVPDEEVSIPTFDTTKIHTANAVSLALDLS